MVRIRLLGKPVESAKADAVAVGLQRDVPLRRQPTVARLDRALGGLIAETVARGDLRGKLKESLWLPTRGKIASPRLLVVGLGRPKEWTLDALREASARAALAARDQRLRTLALAPWSPLPRRADAGTAAQALAEGVLLGLFEYREYKKQPPEADDPPTRLEEVWVCEPRTAATRPAAAGLRDGETVAQSVNLARTLILRPSLAKAPAALAAAARAEARKARVRCQVLGPGELRRKGMGALLGVGSGSARPPRLVVLEYRGRGPRVLLCGKGITFDSGGLNLKPSEGMERMKYDMAGSATVLGAVLAAARLKLPVHVLGILALAENMPSGSAIRPGDVLVAFNRKTIEVANTDAEGRLVLADALSYGVDRFKPDLVVDVATLTGAVRVALGNITTGVLGSDDALVEGLIASGRRTGDDLWRLPLSPAYEKQVQSEMADVKNLGVAGLAGAIAGAAFLKQFVGGHPWAHLDIAGTAWTEKGPGDLNRDYLPKGPTGIGVRLLVEWMRTL